MRKARLLSLLAALACALTLPATAQTPKAAPKAAAPSPYRTAVFAGGCYWTVEYKFDQMKGVVNAVSGYSGGEIANPDYQEVIEGLTGHLEAVRVTYDPRVISYRQLTDHFWRMIDPTDKFGQVCDQGPNYQTAIFVANETERQAALASKAAIDDGPRKGKIVTAIRPAMPFYLAHQEYQDYAKKNREAYEKYRIGCGRDRRLVVIWRDKPKLKS